MRIGSLFSGIGGLELGLEAAGVGDVVWQVEIDPWCREVLALHWPSAERFSDVRAVGAFQLSPVDIVCGGFPCQDISAANSSGRGLAGERSGLWFEYLRIVSELRPRFVVVENVSRLVRRGLDVVAGGLRDLGYAVEATRLRASDLGAPHRRERLFIVAYRDGAVSGPDRAGAPRAATSGEAGGPGVALGDASRAGLEIGEPRQSGQLPAAVGAGGGGESWAAESSVGRAADGLPGWLDGRWPAGRGETQHAWEAPRTAHRVPHRARRLKGLGNAVVPACAYVVGLRVLQLAGEPSA